MTNRLKTLLLGTTAAGLMATAAAAETELTFLVDVAPDTIAVFEAIIEAFEAQNPDITVEIESRPSGAEGDNIVKTRLATGEMTDVFLYNTGSLFQAINPENFLVPITDQPYADNIIDSFLQTVTAGENIYGVPTSTAMGGGIFYNIPIYEQLGLEVPTSWDAFMANNQAIKDAGMVAVAQTYRDTWTSQLFVLSDYYNIQADVPDFAELYTLNEAKIATTPAALRGFEKLQEVYEGGFLNEDFGAATFDDGLRMLATGEAAHYPMLTFAVGAIQATYPDQLNDVGFFAQPGDDADDNGLTVWMPSGLYIPQSSENQEEAHLFLAFVASVESCDIQTATIGAQGPYLIKGCTLPDEVPPAVADLLPYFQEGGQTAPALEFLSPIKGPALEQITVEVGSGIRDALAGAELYDNDVRKQAQQLGLPNW